ncbi:hypothetical protein BD408DRAFT_433499 [Parasitella parasitica]|nr:hypothetical protein BD408DRAFT_433499 [Parasitella parasitica]
MEHSAFFRMVNTTRTLANSSRPGLSSSPSPTIKPNVPWSVIAAGKGKKGKAKQQYLSLSPTIVQPVLNDSESNQATNSQTQPDPIELVRPFIKGFEQGSVLIDITHVKDLSILRDALDDFNKDADVDGRGYNEFLGRCEKTRTYLNHVFMETMWAPNSLSLSLLFC